MLVLVPIKQFALRDDVQSVIRGCGGRELISEISVEC